MAKYIIIEPARAVFIEAKNREVAARLFMEKAGMPEWFFKAHCTIRRAYAADFKKEW